MYHGLPPIPQLKINAVLWDMAELCLGHGMHGGTHGGGEPMALCKVGAQEWESHAHYGRPSRGAYKWRGQREYL